MFGTLKKKYSTPKSLLNLNTKCCRASSGRERERIFLRSEFIRALSLYDGMEFVEETTFQGSLSVGSISVCECLSIGFLLTDKLRCVSAHYPFAAYSV